MDRTTGSSTLIWIVGPEAATSVLIVCPAVAVHCGSRVWRLPFRMDRVPGNGPPMWIATPDRERESHPAYIAGSSAAPWHGSLARKQPLLTWIMGAEAATWRGLLARQRPCCVDIGPAGCLVV